MAIRDELHRLVDELPPGEARAAKRFLQYLLLVGSDPMLRALTAAPLDDEGTTQEEDAGAEEAWQQYLRGEAISAEEAKRASLP